METLKWYPWIGKAFNKSKLLIIGESHYEDGDDWQLGNKETTRIITQKRIDNVNGKWTLHRNVEKTILNLPNISLLERQALWNSVAYWNLVQRLLDSRNHADRPGDEDFKLGWELFFKIYKVLEPKFCLVLGKASFGSLGSYLTNPKSEWKLDKSEFNPNDKLFKLKNGKKEMTLVFINHPSGSFGFDYQKWAQVFRKEFKEINI
ncbi:MAG: hypothetical protein ACPGSD_16925 [Flavobacteriales bacterium]